MDPTHGGSQVIQAKESSGKRSHQGRHHTAGGQREGKVKFPVLFRDPPEQNQVGDELGDRREHTGDQPDQSRGSG